MIFSDGAASQFKNNKNITNLLYHHQDFSLEAAWTFSSSGHGKGPCDGLGAAVKSAARKYLLKQGPEGSFSTAKEFYLFTRSKVNQMPLPSRNTQKSDDSLNDAHVKSDESSDEEAGRSVPDPVPSIDVRWLDETEVSEVFESILKPRWDRLSLKGNFLHPAVLPDSFSVDRIVGIRSFHEFNASSTNSIMCRSVSSSMNVKSFYFKFDRTLQTPIKRVLETKDFTTGSFLIVERDETIYLAQIKTTDARKRSLNVSLLSPHLPCKTFSTSKSPSITIRSTDVLGRLVDPPTTTRMKQLVLTEEQFVSIQEICDEF